MRPKITVYVTNQELAELRHEAGKRRWSVSRYAKERLMPSAVDEQSGGSYPMPRPDDDKRLLEAVRSAVAGGNRSVLDQLGTVIVMLDQFALSTLMHLAEIPEAQKERARIAAERRHRDWQHRVEALLRQLRNEAAGSQQSAAGNGAHA